MPEGAPRIMFLANDIESGFDWENYVNYPDEDISVQPADALQSPDPFARRRLLTAVLKKKQSLSAKRSSAAAGDADLYVRRAALKGLAMLGDASAIPVIEAALVDPENSVRWQAALALADLPGPRVVEKLFESAARDDATFQFRFRAFSEALKKLQASGKLGLPEKEFLASRLADKNAEIREIVLHGFKLIGAPATPAIEAALLEIIRHDVSPYARELALINMRSSFGATETDVGCDSRVHCTAKTRRFKFEPHPHWRCSPRDPMHRREQREQGLTELTALFRQVRRRLSAQRQRLGLARDRPWPVELWRRRPRGSELTLLADRDNSRLATLAWYVLYLPQGDKLVSITAAEDAEAHRHHPKFRDNSKP